MIRENLRELCYHCGNLNLKKHQIWRSHHCAGIQLTMTFLLLLMAHVYTLKIISKLTSFDLFRQLLPSERRWSYLYLHLEKPILPRVSMLGTMWGHVSWYSSSGPSNNLKSHLLKCIPTCDNWFVHFILTHGLLQSAWLGPRNVLYFNKSEPSTIGVIACHR